MTIGNKMAMERDWSDVLENEAIFVIYHDGYDVVYSDELIERVENYSKEQIF